MMKFKLRNIKVSVSYPAVAFLALALICDEHGRVLLCFLASFSHEIGHLVAMKICGVVLDEFSVNLGDISIKTKHTELGFGSDFFVNSGGILANVFLALLSCFVWVTSECFLFRDFAVANACIGFFNFLPVCSLDGGKIISLILDRRFSPAIVQRIINILSIVFVLPMFVIGILLLMSQEFNYSLLFAALYLFSTFISKEFV